MKESNDTRVLVIRLSAMGDVAMTIPVLLALTRTYPGLQINFLTNINILCAFYIFPLFVKGNGKTPF